MKFIKKLTEQIRRHPIISFVIFLLLVAVVLIALVKNGLISECSRHYLKTTVPAHLIEDCSNCHDKSFLESHPFPF